MPNRLPSQLRARTKIVATVGPACERAEQLAALVERGVDRLPPQHGPRRRPHEHSETLATIRRVSQESKPADRHAGRSGGPKIRLGELPGDMVDCAPDAEFRFVRGESSSGPTN